MQEEKELIISASDAKRMSRENMSDDCKNVLSAINEEIIKKSKSGFCNLSYLVPYKYRECISDELVIKGYQVSYGSTSDKLDIGW